MKKLTLVIAACCTLFSFTVNAQDWVKMMNDPKANVRDVQAAFYKWYAQHKTSASDNQQGKEDEEQDYALFKRWEHNMVVRTYPSGVKPDRLAIGKEYKSYISERSKINAHKSEALAKWNYVGNTSTPLYGGNGRVNRVHFYPGNNNIIFATSPDGGLWKTTNGGTTWSTTTDQLEEIGTGDLAINPLKPSIMYLSTGDNDATGDWTPCTIGVLRSADGGATWNPTGMSFSVAAGGAGYLGINQLIFNPADTGTLFAATSFGLYYTKDGGATWTEPINDNIKDVEFEPFHGGTVYAGSYGGKFYRSTDSGKTFTRITAGLSTKGMERLAIGTSPADSNTVYILAVDSINYGFYGIYRSVDRGQTFTAEALRSAGAPNLLGWSTAGADSSGQAWYNLVITVSPTYADSVLVAGSLLWQSTDGGATWNCNTDYYYNCHVDIHSVVYFPGSSNSYLVSCDGGIFLTENHGIDWSNISSDLEISEQYCVGPSADNASLWISGWQDNGSNVSYPSWTAVYGGDGMTCFIDYTNDNSMFASYENGNFAASFDGGATWSNASNGITETGEWNTPWLQDPLTFNIFFAGYKNVWESQDQGTTWNRISTWGTYYINSLAVAPSNDSVICATEYYAIYRTTNMGYTWKNVTGTLPVDSVSLSGIAIDPTNPLKMWVTCSGWYANDKVYQSTNGGLTWINISSGLPNLPVNCIIYQPGTPDGIYIGTDIGVYYRDNTTGGWIPYNSGLPNVEIEDLQLSPGNWLLAATYGRGTWQIQTYVNTSVTELKSSSCVFNLYPNPATDMIKIEADNFSGGNGSILITDMTGRILFDQNIDNVSGLFSRSLNISSLQAGVYFVTLRSGGNQSMKKFIKE